jgi:hypothetical protein
MAENVICLVLEEGTLLAVGVCIMERGVSVLESLVPELCFMAYCIASCGKP